MYPRDIVWPVCTFDDVSEFAVIADLQTLRGRLEPGDVHDIVRAFDALCRPVRVTVVGDEYLAHVAGGPDEARFRSAARVALRWFDVRLRRAGPRSRRAAETRGVAALPETRHLSASALLAMLVERDGVLYL